MNAQADAVAGADRAEATPRDHLGRTLQAGDRVAGGVCVLALILMAALLVGMAFGYRPLVDHSDSMRPAIRAGDLLIMRSEPAAGIRRGEIVSFKDAALAGKLVTHRVLAIHPGRSRLDFVTKGDANPAPESWWATRGASIGVLTLRVPGIGRAIAWVAGPAVRTVVLTLAALLVSIALLRRIWRA